LLKHKNQNLRNKRYQLEKRIKLYDKERENTEMGLPKNPRPEALQAPLLRFSIHQWYQIG
jgi:hypothetical protein